MFSGIIEYLGTVAAVERLGGGKTFAIETGPLSDERSAGRFPGSQRGLPDRYIEVERRQRPGRSSDRNLGEDQSRLPGRGQRKLTWSVRFRPEAGFTATWSRDTWTRSTGCWRFMPLRESKLIEFALNDEIAPFIVGRGSVAVDGVSLTVARLDERAFTVSAIGFTLSQTTLGLLPRRGSGERGDRHYRQVRGGGPAAHGSGAKGEITEDKLRTWGY